MAKNSSASCITRTMSRSWTSILTGSIVLLASVFGLAQEVDLSKSLDPPRKLETLPRVGSVAFERQSRSEFKSDSLPLFPVESKLGLLNSRPYLPSVLRSEGHRLVSTGIHLGETRQERDSPLVIAAEPRHRFQEPAPLARLEAGSTNVEPRKEWTLKPVSALKLETKPAGDPVTDSARATLNLAENGAQPNLVNVGTVAGWIAPNLTYQPLLFEDARLERYGYASPYFGVQPFRSGVHFAGSSLVFPLRVWFHRNECESPLAFERPGTCAPTTRELFVPARSHGWSLR